MTFKIVYIILIISSFNSCSSCSKSGRIHQQNRNDIDNQVVHIQNKHNGKTILTMEKENGVYKIPVLVNGIEMSFIFDTGAGLISISNIEASFMYKSGKLNSEDILGEGKFSDANGDISVGTIINLKEIAIGDRKIYNIQASVVNNSKAPLLFGQSALEKFGKVSIDYTNNTISFE